MGQISFAFIRPARQVLSLCALAGVLSLSGKAETITSITLRSTSNRGSCGSFSDGTSYCGKFTFDLFTSKAGGPPGLEITAGQSTYLIENTVGTRASEDAADFNLAELISRITKLPVYSFTLSFLPPSSSSSGTVYFAANSLLSQTRSGVSSPSLPAPDPVSPVIDPSPKNDSAAGVPEPSSFGLAGVSLLAAGLFVAKRYRKVRSV